MTKRLLTSAFLFLMFFNLSELSAQIMFQRHDIANIPSSNTTIRCHPADLNNDGAMDIVTIDALGGLCHWWKSSGGTNPTFTKIQFDNNFPQAGPIFTADVNGDGHMDILGTSFTGEKVIYWQNDGNNPTPSFTRNVLKSGFGGAFKVIAADLDGDSDIDVAAVARVPKQLRVFYNDGNLNPSFTQVVLSSSLSHIDGLAYGDVNMDGRMDLIVANAGNGQVTLFKGSTTAPNGFTSEVIAYPFYCKQIYTADMNGDGFKDVLNLYQDGHLNKIGYLKSTGGTTPNFTNTNVGTYDNSFSIFPADLDGDGDMDVLGGSNWEDGFRWWENQGGTNPSFQTHLIEKNFVMAWTAKPADMDGDGDMDFVASTGWALHWYENDLIEACEISITCKDPFNFPITQNGGTSVISGEDMVRGDLTDDCSSYIGNNNNLDFTINGQQLLDFFCDDIGPQILTIVATDDNGNSASCTIPINVVDIMPPTITCPPDQTGDLDQYCSFEIPDYRDLASVVDNCSNTIIQTPSPGTTVYSDRTMILTVVDQEGQTNTCTFDLTVSDNTPPAITCKDPFNFPITQNGGTSVISGSDMLRDHLTEDCDYNLDYTINGQQLLDFFCDDIGPQILTIVATDDNGNSASCTISINVVDLIAPTLTCPNDQTAVLDSNCEFEIPDYRGLASVVDNCSNTIIQTPAQGTIVDSDRTMILTAVDQEGQTNTCIFFLTVSDNTPPTITCPSGFTQPNDPGDCGAVVDIPTATANDNCGITFLKARVREVDGNGDPVSGWSSFANDPDGFYAVGRWEVQWRAKDAADNPADCSFIFEVTDNEAPNAVCNNPKVTFNGEASIALLLSDVFDDQASFDNCTSATAQGFSPMSFDCDQLGSIIPVTVTVSDDDGNTTTCTANVSVEGLPCGWSQNPDGVGCTGGSDATYNPTNGSFTVSGDGCYDPNYYSNSDSQGFASTELCGDGEIIAHVTQVTGSGWAGVSMRDDLSSGSRMLQLSVDGVALTKRELRVSPGAIAYNHLFQTQGKTWLRLTRSGNTFGAYHSSDGVSWSPVIITNIPMNGCIQVGLFTENGSPTGTATATFESVQINGAAPLSTPATPDIAFEELQEEPSVNLYPNPARNIITVDFNQEMEQPTLLRLRNSAGQVIEERQVERYNDRVQWNIEQLVNGMYLIEIHKEGQKVEVERFIKN